MRKKRLTYLQRRRRIITVMGFTPEGEGGWLTMYGVARRMRLQPSTYLLDHLTSLWVMGKIECEKRSRPQGGFAYYWRLPR